MRRELITYLYSFKDNQYHLINDFIKSNFSHLHEDDIRSTLVYLSNKQRIEVELKKHERLGQYTANIHPDHNVPATIENYPLFAKLTIEERERIEDEENNKSETKNPITISGDVSHSVIGSQDFSQARINPTIQTVINTPKKNDKATSTLEKLYWLAGILVAALAIYEFIIKRFLHS